MAATGSPRLPPKASRMSAIPPAFDSHRNMGEDRIDGSAGLADYDADSLDLREGGQQGSGDGLRRGLDQEEAPLRQRLDHGAGQRVVANCLGVVVGFPGAG